MAKKAEILPRLFLDSVNLTTKDSGVYAIINRSNGRMYVGSSKNLSGRISTHKCDFRRGLHACKNLQKEIWNNPENFEFVVLEWNVMAHSLISREQFWMDFFQSNNPDFGYNRSPRAASIMGFKHDPETIDERWGSGLRGKKRPPRNAEWCKKISLSHIGKESPLKQAVIELKPNGDEVHWKSATDAAKAFGKKSSGLIVRSLKSECTAYGSRWRYA